MNTRKVIIEGMANFKELVFFMITRFESMATQIMTFAMTILVLPAIIFTGTKIAPMIAKMTQTIRQDEMLVSSSLLKSIFQFKSLLFSFIH